MLFSDLNEAVGAAAELENIVRDQTNFIKAATRRIEQLYYENRRLQAAQSGAYGGVPAAPADSAGAGLDGFSLLQPDLSAMDLLGTPFAASARPGAFGGARSGAMPGSVQELEAKLAALERKNAYLSHARPI